MEIRTASASDAEAVAQLHANSWRRNYRGAYLDSYLDGDVVSERVAVWTERLGAARRDTCTVVADDEGEVVGFAHTIFDDDPEWGALLDNLHVANALKGQGVGTRLMAASAQGVLERTPPTGLYLWVLEQNAAAQAFYRARGGAEVGRTLKGPFPGGGNAMALRIAWPDPARLLFP